MGVNNLDRVIREGSSKDPKNEKETARQRAQNRVFQAKKTDNAKALRQEQACTFREQNGGPCGWIKWRKVC
jgi:hypothetical protein